MKLRQFLTFIFFFGVNIYAYYPKQDINSELEPYYDYYVSKILDSCSVLDIHNPIKVKVDFSNKLGMAVGICQWNLNGFHLYVDGRTWPTLSEDARHELIAHEVTHCILRLGHDINPNSYMDGFSELGHLNKAEVMRQLNRKIDLVCKGN